jgi:hypothetical protein
MEDAAAEEEVPEPAKKRSSKAAVRRATVRYYSRMNPERVYPLLVLVTRDMVERVRKKHVEQRSSGPFKADADVPVEIEPVLPGCDCHPPKLVARPGDGDLTATFRVVPRVLGVVEGACVTIRQDHATLAEIGLKTKVVQRTWVLFSGAMTFLVPGLSSVLKHFGLDFEPQSEAGFSFYLAAARLVFDEIPPLGLTIGLGLATGLLWWFTRPRTREVFWDVETTGPGEKLRRIAAAKAAGRPESADEMMELLRAYPAYQPARLFYADWHYEHKKYEAALKGYERAFKLGVAKARDYLRASLAASGLGQNERALQILQTADRVLPPNEMNGVMLFNMACYHARLGQLDEAMACLPRAAKAGYKKRESYEKDRDLDPLRGRNDFKRLLGELFRA